MYIHGQVNFTSGRRTQQANRDCGAANWRDVSTTDPGERTCKAPELARMAARRNRGTEKSLLSGGLNIEAAGATGK